MPNVLPVDYSGVVLEPKSGRVPQPNVAGLGVTNQGSLFRMKDCTNELTNLVEAKDLWFLQSFG
jgi:hypothetical protein